MALNKPQKQLGSYTVYTSSGTTITVRWGFGALFIKHEYVAAGGWTGKVMGVTNPSKINGISVANISKVNGI